MIRTVVIGVVIASGTLFPAASADAHSKLIDSDPKERAFVHRPPSSLRLEFSEPPISADNLVVEDGCGVDVVASAEVQGKDIVAELGDGQPGRWQVSSRVISVVDGHETTDGFTFRVHGRADCAAATTAPDREPTDDGASVLPLLLGLGGITALVVVGAFFLRRWS